MSSIQSLGTIATHRLSGGQTSMAARSEAEALSLALPPPKPAG
jgi:hypothetical protein